jgi:hypothetical protein
MMMNRWILRASLMSFAAACAQAPVPDAIAADTFAYDRNHRNVLPGRGSRLDRHVHLLVRVRG